MCVKIVRKGPHQDEIQRETYDAQLASDMDKYDVNVDGNESDAPDSLLSADDNGKEIYLEQQSGTISRIEEDANEYETSGNDDEEEEEEEDNDSDGQ